eukprot:59586-Chlamydomonas_euryale.AAC.1
MLSYYSNNSSSSADGSGSGSPAGSTAGGRAGGGGRDGSAMRSVSADMRLSREDITTCRAEAIRRVSVPPHVIQMVTELRTYLQEKFEPPVYVSDRRL